MKAILLSALACLALAGCVTPEQLAAEDDAKCTSYGAPPGSPGYAACRVTIDNNRAQAQAAALRALAASNGAAQSAPAAARLDSTGVMCVKQSESVSGFNRVCNYRCGVSNASKTVGAAQLCPINP